MICQTCHGNGFLTPPIRTAADQFVPCPTHYRSGVDHCCDGDQPSPRDEINTHPRRMVLRRDSDV